MIKINDVNINYFDNGLEAKDTIVLLHGWGQNVKMMEMLGKPFEKKFRIINIDLPGFGASEEPKTSWGIIEYEDMLKKLLKKLKVTNPIIIGHSFGGRLAIKYAADYEVKKLVLLASPFRHSTKVSFKTKILKLLKKIPILNKLEGWAKNKFGSVDYRNASPIMKGVLVKNVNVDLTEDAKKIKAPTIIIFGTNDLAVPYEEGKALESLIPNAGLITYEGCTHYAYLERLDQTIRILKEFFK